MQAREELQSWNWIVIAVDLLSLRFKRSAPLSTGVPEPLYTCASLTNWDTGNCSLHSMNTSDLSREKKEKKKEKKKETKPLIIACKPPCIEKDLSESQTSAYLPYNALTNCMQGKNTVSIQL